MKKDVEKACAGDRAAASAVVERLAPTLERWASKRLPRDALATVAPAVRNGLEKALSELRQGTRHGEGALMVQARAALLDALRAGDMTRSQLVRTVGERPLEAYETALAQLDAVSREAVVLRIELGYAYDRLAEAVGAASSDEARVIVSSAMLQMSELMEAP